MAAKPARERTMIPKMIYHHELGDHAREARLTGPGHGGRDGRGRRRQRPAASGTSLKRQGGGPTGPAGKFSAYPFHVADQLFLPLELLDDRLDLGDRERAIEVGIVLGDVLLKLVEVAIAVHVAAGASA